MGPSKGVMVEFTCVHVYFFNQFFKHIKFIKIKACSYKASLKKKKKRTNNNAVFVIFFIQITMYRHSLHVYINLILFKVKQKISFE